MISSASERDRTFKESDLETGPQSAVGDMAEPRNRMQHADQQTICEHASCSRDRILFKDSDKDHGSVALLHAYSGAQVRSTEKVEAIFNELRRKEEHVSEFNLEGPRTNSWRMGCRLCCVNTKIYNDPGLSKSRCIALMQKLLGNEYCPAESTLGKCHDGFWIVALSMSVMIGKLVTPYRAAACFKRFRNQKYAMTDYGYDLLQRYGVSWPPCPDAVATPAPFEIMTPPPALNDNGSLVAITAPVEPPTVFVSSPTNIFQNMIGALCQPTPIVDQDPRSSHSSEPIITPSLELLLDADLDVQHIGLNAITKANEKANDAQLPNDSALQGSKRGIGSLQYPEIAMCDDLDKNGTGCVNNEANPYPGCYALAMPRDDNRQNQKDGGQSVAQKLQRAGSLTCTLCTNTCYSPYAALDEPFLVLNRTISGTMAFMATY